MAKLVDPKKLISLADAGRMFGYNAEFLRQLCDSGRIESWFIANSWLTTRKNVEEYIRTKKTMGRPRKAALRGKKRKTR